MLQEFAARLQQLINLHNGGNQSELARILKVSPQAVQKWLDAQVYPRDHTMVKIAQHYNVPVSWLKFGEGKLPELKKPEPRFILDYVDVERGEARLLHLFRSATDIGAKQLLMSAERIEKKPAAELPAKPSSAMD